MEPANAYDPIELDAYFASKPFLVAGRVGEVASALARALGAAAAHRGDRRRQFAAYREIIESLGPAFVKVAQTLSTRPDLIGEELASELIPKTKGDYRRSVIAKASGRRAGEGGRTR